MEKFGVGLLLFANVDGIAKMYVVRELKGKPELFKKAGMIGPPFETMEDIDGGCVQCTIKRLVKEETGIPSNLIVLNEVIHERFNLIPGKPNIFTTYACGIFTGDSDNMQQFVPEDNDIVFEGWHSLCDLENQEQDVIRIEVLPILNHFRRSGYYAKIIQSL